MNCIECGWPCSGWTVREDKLCSSCRVRITYQRWQELKTPESLKAHQIANYQAMVD